MTTFYRVIRAIARVFTSLFYPIQARGLENVPAEGAFILCSNHVSALDPVFYSCKIQRQIHFMSKRELFRNRLIGAFLKKVGAFPVNRGETDLTSLRTAFKLMREGKALGIFGQGHRNAEECRLPFHTGTALIALRSGTVVIPAHIASPVRPFRPVRLTLGAAVDLSEYGNHIDSDTLKQATEKIEAAVWSLPVE